MKYFFFLVMVLMMQPVIGQESFDLMKFTAPTGWKRIDKDDNIEFSKIKNNNWVQVFIIKSTTSAGTVQDDFQNEWNRFLGLHNPTTPQTSEATAFNNWQTITGVGSFTFNRKPVAAQLTVYTGYNRCFSIIVNTNSSDFNSEVKNFYSSIAINDDAVAQLVNQQQGGGNTQSTAENNAGSNSSETFTPSGPMATGFTFNSTNFDDGWVSTVQQDWVEVTKGNIKVLLHYPKEGTMFPADAGKLANDAWNILVAPRYSNMQDYKFISPSGDDGSLASKIAMATMTEKSSGSSVFVVLFNRTAGWTEVIVPNVKTFTDEFGFDPTSVRFGTNSHNWGGWIVTTSTGATIDANGSVFTKLDAMLLKNKFAVSAEDLYGTGEWAQNFSSNTFWANAYNGAFEGVSTYAASKWFIFASGQSYKWHIVAVNTYGGSTNGVKADAEGTFKSLGNWQLYFSNIEGKPKKYDAYYTAIKGGRILWMNDAEHPGSGIFQGFSKK